MSLAELRKRVKIHVHDRRMSFGRTSTASALKSPYLRDTNTSGTLERRVRTINSYSLGLDCYNGCRAFWSNLVDSTSDASLIHDGADTDNVDLENILYSLEILCLSLPGGRFEPIEINLGEPDDFFLFGEFGCRADEEREVSLGLCKQPETQSLLGAFRTIVKDGSRRDVACKDGRHEGLELVGIKVLRGGGHKRKGQNELAEHVPEEREIEHGRALGWG